MEKMTFAQKALAQATNTGFVQAGAVVIVEPIVCLSHDNSAAIAKNFKSIGAKKVFDPSRIVIVLDHCVPAADDKHAKNHREIREFVSQQGIGHFYDINVGVCHQVLCEKGHARPGAIIVGSDSHTPTAGAYGAFATGIGRTEAASVWATGRMWFRVPDSIRIELSGQFRPRVSAKDLALKIIGDIGSDGALYLSVEFTGPAAKAMPMAERMLLCNMAAEMGAKNAVFEPDDITTSSLAGLPEFYPSRPMFADHGAAYERVLTYDLSEIEPGLACPHSLDLFAPAREKSGTVIHQALIGTCTNGRIEDFREAAQVLKGHKVAKSVRLLLFPASMSVYRQLITEGLAEFFIDAGAVIMNPGCGPCLGAHEGVLAAGEVCISTANRNFKGRMGCNDAFVYLASPATVAASAITGVITSPLNLGGAE